MSQALQDRPQSIQVCGFCYTFYSISASSLESSVPPEKFFGARISAIGRDTNIEYILHRVRFGIGWILGGTRIGDMFMNRLFVNVFVIVCERNVHEHWSH